MHATESPEVRTERDSRQVEHHTFMFIDHQLPCQQLGKSASFGSGTIYLAGDWGPYSKSAFRLFGLARNNTHRLSLPLSQLRYPLLRVESLAC